MEKCGIVQSLSTMVLFMAPSVATAVMLLTHINLQLNLTTSMVSVGGTWTPTPSAGSFLTRGPREGSFPSPCPSKI